MFLTKAQTINYTKDVILPCIYSGDYLVSKTPRHTFKFKLAFNAYIAWKNNNVPDWQ